jgi:Microtubule-binding stalk of dynein motor
LIFLRLTFKNRRIFRSWEDARLMLMKDNFFLDLVYFDKSRVTPAVTERLAELCRNPSFTPEAVRFVSEAAAHVCQWLCALNAFSRRQSNIKPTLQKLHDTQTEMKRVRNSIPVSVLLLPKWNASCTYFTSYKRIVKNCVYFILWFL